MEGEQQGFTVPVDADGFVEQEENFGAGLPFGQTGRGTATVADHLADPPIYVWSVRLQ